MHNGFHFNGILASAIQVVRKISAVIVTVNYLCYKEQKSPYNFFHILIFTNYLRLKLRTNGNIDRRELDSGLEGNQTVCSHTDPFAFSTVLPQLSDQKISRQCYLILRKLQRTHNFF